MYVVVMYIFEMENLMMQQGRGRVCKSNTAQYATCNMLRQRSSSSCICGCGLFHCSRHGVTYGTGVDFGVRLFAANSCSVSFEGVKSCFSHTFAPYKRSGPSFFEFEFFNNNCRRLFSSLSLAHTHTNENKKCFRLLLL